MKMYESVKKNMIKTKTFDPWRTRGHDYQRSSTIVPCNESQVTRNPMGT